MQKAPHSQAPAPVAARRKSLGWLLAWLSACGGLCALPAPFLLAETPTQTQPAAASATLPGQAAQSAPSPLPLPADAFVPSAANPLPPATDAAPAAAADNAAGTPGAAAAADGGAAAEAATIKKDIGSQVFFDGRSTSFNRNLSAEVFEGDVVVIGAGTLIGADKITFDRTHNQFEAQGSVVILSRTQLFIGDSVTYHLDTGDFVITSAIMLSNDQQQIDRVTRKIFGFTATELAFEQGRQEELAQLGREEEAVRRDVANRGAVDEDHIDHYSVLLERASLIQGQDNPSLSKMTDERRDMFKRRREFWEASKKSALAGLQSAPVFTAYMHLEGQTLSRMNGNDYAARNALFTPCRCDLDESPAWAFRADEIDAQLGGYADMTNAVLEIKGIPVLYLPRMKMPLKDKRQSGFLTPTTGYQQVSGNTFTAPLFIDLGPNQDATATTDFYETRGTRLGLEYRIQQHEYSGWNLKLEGIRDSLWTQEIGTRQVLGDIYRNGLAYSRANAVAQPLSADLSPIEYTRRAVESRTFWSQSAIAGNRVQPVDDQINYYMAVPRNTWRGSYSWRGVSYLAPRLSFVSDGEVNSDHRYTEELYLPDNFEQALAGGMPAKAFSPAHAQLHLDGRDVYAGLGSRFADNLLTNQRFEGQQIPADFKLQTRYFTLTPERSAIPVYGQLLTENMQISQASAGDTLNPVPAPLPGKPIMNLGNGAWRRVQFATVAPLLTDSIIQVNHFSEFETRYIQAQDLAQKNSQIQSWVTGIEFRLPIDGKMEAPSWLRNTECEDLTKAKKLLPPECPLPGEEPQKQYIHHVMNWSLRLAARPVAVVRGPYTNTTGYNLAYFATDIRPPPPGSAYDVDHDVHDEERLYPYQRVTFATDQTWSLLARGWQRVGGSLPSAPPTLDKETSHERARRELNYSLERPVGGATSMYDESTQRWLIDRFQLKDRDYGTPVSLHADIAYDFLDAKRRESEKLANVGQPADKQVVLDEPWKPANISLGLNWQKWALASAATYDLYKHAAITESVFLTFPTYLKTSLVLGYTISKTFQTNSDSFNKTTVTSSSIDSTLIPRVTSFIRVNRQVIDASPSDYTSTIQTVLGMKYTSTSDCWGLQFAREKDYAVAESDASYVLRFSLVFAGQDHPLPDMSGGVVNQAQSGRTL